MFAVRRWQPHLECLDSRILPAVTLNSGVLEIIATEQNDVIDVRLLATDTTKVAVSVNNQTQTFNVADVTSLMRRLGELTGREAAAGPLVAGLEQRIVAVKKAVLPLARPRVLYVLWPEPLIVPGRGAIVTELIQLAGGQSLTADDPDAWPRYSLEAAVAKSPEVILLANHGAGTGAVAVDKWKRLTSLPAVKSGRLLSVNGDLLHRYGPRFVDGLEQLARAIHPEAFR